MPKNSVETLSAMAMQFGRVETDGLENPHIFEMSDVRRSGKLLSLRSRGKPADVLKETKTRIFAA